MYVCPKCNCLVERPNRRWWSQWRYCPRGHVLYVRGLGASRERALWKSFAAGFTLSLVVFVWPLLILVVHSDSHPRPFSRSVAALLGVGVAILFLTWGSVLLARARRWYQRGGAIQRLVPNAKGKAYGLLTSVLCQIVVITVLIIAK